MKETAPIFNPEQPQKISLIEKSSAKHGRFPANQEKINPLRLPPDPNTLSISEYDESLTQAREFILKDDSFFKEVIDAIIKKVSTGSNKGFAEIENILIDICATLKASDIDILINQLDKKVLMYLGANKSKLGISEEDYEKYAIRQGLYNKDGWQLNANGIKSVLNFLRARVTLLTSRPEQKFVIGSNNELDSRHKIDLIEALFSDDQSKIEQLNLIQIKNSTPTEEEVSDIVEKHKRYVEERLMKIQEIGEIKLSGEEEKKIFQDTLGNQGSLYDKIFEICFDYQGMEQSALIERLGLGNLDILRRAWILQAHFEIIKEQINEIFEEGYMTEDSKNILINDLEQLLKNSITKSGMPLKVMGINSVNSIIAVGPRIIKQVEIYNSKKTGKALAASA